MKFIIFGFFAFLSSFLSFFLNIYLALWVLSCSMRDPVPRVWVLSRFSLLWLFATPWTVAHQAPLSMGFSGKNARVSCHALLQGIKPVSPAAAALQEDSLPLSYQGSSQFPDQGSNPGPPALGAPSPSHWITREVPSLEFSVSISFPCSVKNINHTLFSNKTENPTQKKNWSWNASGWRTAHSGLHCVAEASTQGPSRKDFPSGTLKAAAHPIWRCFKHLSGCWHGGSDSKGSACNAGDLGSIPGLGRSPGGRAWQPTPVFLPGESPWTEEPGGLQSRASQRVRQDWRLSD